MKRKTIIAAVVAVAMLASMGVFAVADTAEYDVSGVDTEVSGEVTARANIRPILVLTITTPDAPQTVDFGDVEPEDTDSAVVDIEVKSNKIYDLTKTVVGDVIEMGFETTLEDALGEGRGVNDYSDTYSIDIPWDTEPGEYTATITYTVTQN